MAAAKRTPKAAPVLLIPDPVPGITTWLVCGLDPSLSRTGIALMEVNALPGEATAEWLYAGSLAPMSASDPVWIRSKAIALAVREAIGCTRGSLRTSDPTRVGLIVAMEFPTPQNDFLTSINRILHLVLFDQAGASGPGLPCASLTSMFAEVRVLMVNASTLRSLMGLTQRGAKNKKENIEKAYTFLDRSTYPNLDTDACDAVLMAMMGRHAASVLAGCPEALPPRLLLSLCDGTPEVKGAGRNARIRTKGILHRPEYWYRYTPASYAVECRNARERLRKLERKHFTV